MDEASPQTTANTVREWSPEKPVKVKNTDRIKANAVGFLSINGNSAISFPDSSKIDDVLAFFDEIRNANGDRTVIVILDNFSAHRSKRTMAYAESINIRLVFLPPYSPHLNPIEFVWKSIKRAISKNRIVDRPHMTSLLEERFLQEAGKPSYFAYWIGLFHGELLKIVG